MRLALVVSDFPKTSETFIANKAAALIQNGIDVHIVFRSSKESDWKAYEHLKPIFNKKRLHKLWPHNRPWKAILFFPIPFIKALVTSPSALFRYLSRGYKHFGSGVFKQFYLDEPLVSLNPAIIHFEFGAQAIGKMYLKELTSAKLLVSFRGYDLNFVGLDKPGFYDEIFQKADALHLLGNDLWKRAIARGCPPEKSHTLIAPAVDTNFFMPSESGQKDVALENSQGPLKILSVGRLEWKKGYEYSLHAMQILKSRGVDFRFRIVGGGHFIDVISFVRNRFGLQKEVELMGVLNQSQIKEQLKWADVFLHAAVSEGFCNAVLEAQSMKVPVVATDADGLSENVANGETGFIVPRRDAEAIAQKLMLLRDPDLRKKLAEAARVRVQTKFNVAQQIAAFQSLYESLLEPEMQKAPQLKPVSVPGNKV